MPSAILDLDDSFEIEQNSDFIRTFQCRDENGDPYDLTGAELVAQIKRPLQRGTANAEFTVEVFEPPTSGAGVMSLSEDQTRALNTREPYVWDMLMRRNGVSTRLIMGDVTVSPFASEIDDADEDVPATWDSNLITWDSNLVTWDTNE